MIVAAPSHSRALPKIDVYTKHEQHERTREWPEWPSILNLAVTQNIIF